MRYIISIATIAIAVMVYVFCFRNSIKHATIYELSTKPMVHHPGVVWPGDTVVVLDFPLECVVMTYKEYQASKNGEHFKRMMVTHRPTITSFIIKN